MKTLNSTIVPADLAFFRFRQKNNRTFLTNDAGEYCFLRSADFDKLISGRSNAIPLQKLLELKEKSFFNDSLNTAELAKKYALRHNFLSTGTILHIVVVTLRCDHGCLYCQSSSKSPNNSGYDMDRATAQRVVDRIFESPSASINIEFQGGEPLLNFTVVRFIIEYALKKNKAAGKQLVFSFVSNLSSITKDQLDYLVSKKIGICTSLDGPQNLHDKQRICLKKQPSHKNTVRCIKRFRKIFKMAGFPNRINALATITKFSFPYYKNIVDEYIKLGLNNIHLRPANPLGLAKANWRRIGFSSDKFLSFYRKCLDYILQVNLNGTFLKERSAAIFLQKILTNSDPNYLDMRSPCGAGIGQLAYNYNGDIYTCDEARMLGEMGDGSFRLGNAATDNYSSIQQSPVVKTICISSCLENIAGCSDCAFLHFCGVCPIYNVIQTKNIFGKEPHNERCKINQGILDHLLKLLENREYLRIFKNWIEN